MILYTSENSACVYTLSQEDGDELYFAPIYSDGSVNLHEFAPVDCVDELDEEDMLEIRNRLSALCQLQ
jgi:hypothetical protein